MIKKIKLIVFAFFCLVTCLPVNAQDYKIEQSIIDCAGKTQKADGILFKEKIFAHEQLLISEKLLKDNSGSSYLMVAISERPCQSFRSNDATLKDRVIIQKFR